MGDELSVVVVEELPALRRGLASLLVEQGIEVVQPQEPVDWVTEQHQPVALMGARSAEHLRVLTRLVAAQPALAAVVVVPELTEVAARAAILAGASGVVDQEVDGEELADALRLAARGVCNVAVLMVCGWAAGGKPLDPPVALGKDDLEVLHLLAAGKTAVQISLELAIPERTLHRRLVELYKRMGVDNRYQAVTAAAGWRLVHIAPPDPTGPGSGH